MFVVPKKTSTIYARVPDELKEEFKAALDKLGLGESFFLRSAAEALVKLVREKKDVSLPVRVMDVESRRKLEEIR